MKIAETPPDAPQQDIVLVRTFDAPVEAVWRAWTDAEQVMRWWGPKHYTCPWATTDYSEAGMSECLDKLAASLPERETACRTA